MLRRLQACGPGPYSALAWRAGLEQGRHFLSLRKALPLEEMASLAAVLPGTLVSVQRNPAEGEVARLAGLAGRPVHDFGDTNADLEDALALMACLDEYVGVSSTNIHLLAGLPALARVRVFSVLEWRWLLQGEESPWYKGFRVFRQQPGGSWDPAIRQSLLDAPLKTSS
jgi:hypothetical protein